MTQGDIYWYTFKAPDKRRPVLLLTRNSAISFLDSPDGRSDYYDDSWHTHGSRVNSRRWSPDDLHSQLG